MPALTRKEYERIYVQYHRLVMKIVHKYINIYRSLFFRHEFEDLVNTVFMEIPAAWKNFEGGCPEGNYVGRIAENVINNELRKRERRKQKESSPVNTLTQNQTDPPDLGEATQPDTNNNEHQKYVTAESESHPVVNGGTLPEKTQTKTLIDKLVKDLGEQDPVLPVVINYFTLGFTDKEIGIRVSRPPREICRLRNQAYHSIKLALKKMGINSYHDLL